MTSYNVLVVDDELDIRELIQEILTEEGYKVTVASSAREAKEARINRDFDLILFSDSSQLAELSGQIDCDFFAPKSNSLTRPSGRTMTLALFRSR